MSTIVYPENEALRYVIAEQKKEIERLRSAVVELKFDRSEKIRLGGTPKRKWKYKMGHFLSGDNLYVCRSSPTIRRCRACKRSASKKYSRRTLSQALTPTPSEGENGC